MITASTQQASVPNLLVMCLASGKLTHALAKQQSCIASGAIMRIGKAAVMYTMQHSCIRCSNHAYNAAVMHTKHQLCTQSSSHAHKAAVMRKE